MTLSTTDLTPRIGTLIAIDKQTLLSGTYSREIRELLAVRCVLVFRDAYLEDEEQLVFAKTLGQIIPQDGGGLYKITLDPSESDTADLLLGTFAWHFDGTNDEFPPRATMLSPRRLSETGGQTEFANMYAAYEDLPASDKRLVDGLKVVHDRETLGRALNPNPSEAELTRWRARPSKVCPLVWNHVSGRKSLVLGQKAKSVVGMDPAEGRALIARMQSWATQPHYVYRHEWQIGDLLIWDNTGVIHRAEPYPLDSGRLLTRTTLVGEEALA
jgi:alpha-ketoglutarate-dependent taurine dioxygenase